MKNTWVNKNGYETLLLANDSDLNLPNTEAQVVRFYQGKYAHYHKVKTEFFYVTSGEGFVVIEGEVLPLKKGISIVVKPGMKHEFINKSDVPLEAVMFKTNSTADDTYF
jgi:mannose-6-phosphate isomerase-like protein (cupin superfamily)